MRLAFFSDVHGNPVAFERCLEAIGAAGADSVVFLGDLVHYGPLPWECIRIAMDGDFDCIQGNCDRAVARGRSATGEHYDNPQWSRQAEEIMEYTLDSVSPQQKKWLKKLPEELRFQVGRKTLHCVHGLPGAQDRGLAPDAADDIYDSILTRSGADILVCGLTHRPTVIRRPGGLILNPGAVGGGTVPSGGTFMILEISEEGSVEIGTHGFRYEPSPLEEAYREAGTGDIFLKCLKLGRDQRGYWHTDEPAWRQKWAEP